jgi:hypothetical protein
LMNDLPNDRGDISIHGCTNPVRPC